MEMSTAGLFLLTAFGAAAYAGGLACWLFVKRREAAFYPSLALVFTLACLANVAHGFGGQDESHELFWYRLALALELCLPGALLHAGVRFLPVSQDHAPSADLRRVLLIGLLGLSLAGLSMTDWVLVSASQPDAASLPMLGDWGQAPYIFLVLATAMALAQMERVFRSSRELTRYRLKLVIIGLAGLGGYEIYYASETLLVSMWREEHLAAFGVVSLMSSGLVTLGIARSRFKELLFNTQVSQQALMGSVTFIAVGLYLLLVGAVGAWLRRIDQPLGYELSVVVVLGALAALVALATSKTTRSEIKRFLARNFSRSKYDYRAEWLRVTQSFQGATTREAIVECLHDLLVKTFATTTIAVWTLREADQRYHQAKPADPTMPTIEATHPVIQKLMSQDDPVMLEERSGDRFEASDPFIRLKARLCSPIYVQDRLTAFVMLGTQPREERYGVDDCDLLRGICHHAGALFAHADLAEERRASAELEALHRFSVFCLHDIKNLAARLSLVAQNAERHGHDPAFQQSALRTVADTARKMTDLISKLSRQSLSSPVGEKADLMHLPSLVEEVVAPLRSDQRIALYVEGHLDVPIRGVREQIQQVLTNVVLNARQAIIERGSISIVVARSKDSAIITIDDTGRGVPATMLDRLFRPSQSSRPGGLGVGLYQCKRIIEAHGGTITLCSAEGKGTRVRIELPLADSLYKAGVGRP
ncbi:putative Histidine kinase [Candidatus Nitrospira inopinata]|jgi:putative PEP-CTERM system histidine kinase|uniref:histidine kinase n=2 Tax=Candidatus Nitrospira inopinata TaxID=1715989 RepID=A0A0S4KVP8_9BACT|nr:putative Histidine kinase [Candidatus Nitrospira inopinata]